MFHKESNARTNAMKAIQSLAMLLLLLMLHSSVNAQEIKIGYMNPQAVLDALPQTDQLRQQMESYLQNKQQELIAKEQSVNAEYQAFLQNAINLSEVELESEQERLAGLREELNQMQQNAEVEVQRRRAELLNPILQKMDEAVAAIAEEMGLDFVLNEGSRSGDAFLFFGQEELNITQRVIDRVKNS